MPRQKRLDIAGAIHHVIVRGLERRKLFRDDDDREELLRRLEKALGDTDCICYAWALIPNHFHLLIRTGKEPLSALMRRVLTGYAVYFNNRHKCSGYVYQNRYKSILCQEDAYFLELVRYIHLNPVRCGLVKGLAGLNRYRWSGHSVLVGRNKNDWQETGEVLSRFGKRKSRAIEGYREFIRDGLEMGKRPELTGGGLRRSAGGSWEAVLELSKAKDYWRGDERILGDGDFVEGILEEAEEEMKQRARLVRAGWDLNRLAKRICEHFGITDKELRQKGRNNTISTGRALFCYIASKQLGVSGKDIGGYLGITQAAVSQSIGRGRDYADESAVNLLS